MARYPLQDARRYIVQAFMRLNKVHNLQLALLDLEYADLMGWDFIKAKMWDKKYKQKFDVMLNEFIFTREDTMTNLDTQAKIIGKNLTEREKIILRVAYTIWKDWISTGSSNYDEVD